MKLSSRETLPRVLDKLCTLFDEELERQMAVQRMCEAQGRSARGSDMEALEVHTQALVVLMEDALHSEKSRVALLQWVVEHYRLPEKEHTLSDLISVVPQPWRGRMRAFQISVREVLATTQDIVASNERFMTQASEKIEDTIQLAVEHVTGKPDGYSPTGSESSEYGTPALLNTVG